MSVKHIDPKEFQQLGFLQEANRLFFHPHGLALELTSVDEDGDTALRPRIRNALASASGMGETPPIGSTLEPDVLTALTEAVVNELSPPGSYRLSGVWDYRDDPEGIIFGSGGYGDSAERAANIQAERGRHASARKALFGGDSDIEPLDYVYEEA